METLGYIMIILLFIGLYIITWMITDWWVPLIVCVFTAIVVIYIHIAFSFIDKKPIFKIQNPQSTVNKEITHKNLKNHFKED